MDLGTLTIMTAVNLTVMQHLLRCIVLNAVMSWVLKVGNMDGIMVIHSP